MKPLKQAARHVKHVTGHVLQQALCLSEMVVKTAVKITPKRFQNIIVRRVNMHSELHQILKILRTKTPLLSIAWLVKHVIIILVHVPKFVCIKATQVPEFEHYVIADKKHARRALQIELNDLAHAAVVVHASPGIKLNESVRIVYDFFIRASRQHACYVHSAEDDVLKVLAIHVVENDDILLYRFVVECDEKRKVESNHLLLHVDYQFLIQASVQALAHRFEIVERFQPFVRFN
jgi:uncharacterized protein (UPF0218 family)